MFSFYTRGMSFVDIALLKKADLFPDEICYRRHKTGQLMRVGMNRQIIRILTRYEHVVGEYVFPLFTEEQEPYAGYKNAYHKIRYALKKISCSLGLSTPLRLHAARHSWATIAKEHGIPAVSYTHLDVYKRQIHPIALVLYNFSSFAEKRKGPHQ